MDGTWLIQDSRSSYTVTANKENGALVYKQKLADGKEVYGDLRPPLILDGQAWMWEADLNNKARIRFRLEADDSMVTSYRRAGTAEWKEPSRAVRVQAVDPGQPQEGPLAEDTDFQAFLRGKGKGKGDGKSGLGKGKPAPARRGKGPMPYLVSETSFSAGIRRLVLSAFAEPEDAVLDAYDGLNKAAEQILQDVYQPYTSAFDVLPPLPISKMFTEDELDEHKKRRARKVDPRNTISAVAAIRNMPGLAHPLTFNEEQMLRLFVTDPRSMAYNLAAAQRSRVPLTVEQCELAHRIVLERHEVLRSSFSLEDPKNPTRKVHKEHQGGFYALAVLDQAQVNAIAAMDYAAPHMLGVSGIRLHYAPSRDNFGTLYVNMHHILADNDALMTFWEESFQIQELLYYGYSKEAVIERLPKLPVQFTDFAYWQKSLFSQGLLAPDLAYWGKQVIHSQPPMVLDIPIDVPRPRVWVAVGDHVNISLDQELLQPVMDLNPRASPFALVVTNFSLALMRMCNQNVVHMATAFALRSLPAVQNLIGNFLNMLPIRVAYDPDEPYLDIVSRVATSAINVQRYNLAPFIQIVSETQPHYAFNDPSRNPVYQSMVDVVPGDDTGDDQIGLKGVLDVFLFAMTKNGLMHRLACVFSTTVLTRQTAQTMLMHVKALTMWAVMHAKSPIPRMLPTHELAQEAQETGVILTHVLVRGKGLPSVAAVQSGLEASSSTLDQRGIRASRRFKHHSALEFGSDIPQHLMKSAHMPTPLQPPRRSARVLPAEIVPAKPAMASYPTAKAATASPSHGRELVQSAPSQLQAEPSVQEEMAARRAEAQRRRERSYQVAARWAQTQRDSELILLSEETNPLDDAEAFPRIANRKPRGFTAFAASRGEGRR
mmetsp:Transcript_61846/g.109840  ORF Transcript_61846/g.109840 Transcript_61846/m.109840 type:complete len:883 (-) Transcript_61846:114-2762(-)